DNPPHPRRPWAISREMKMTKQIPEERILTAVIAPLIVFALGAAVTVSAPTAQIDRAKEQRPPPPTKNLPTTAAAGQEAGAIARLTNDLKKAGVISGSQQGAIQ